ncbi:DDE-type integrase/transposase/recombinase, partial [Klebsiella pneumoniae]|uniref:DDE-type integrase/transposase/recombinase n=1 Tax=Klebsiella pneumoniae TaxID=573 RepID=UPI003A809629
VALSADGHSLLWHSRLGHPSTQIINSLMSQLGFSSIHVNNCDSYSIAKSHKLPFTLSEKRTTAPFQLIHSDLWGPTVVPSFAGFRYYICFVDDFTKYTWLYPLKHKSQAYTTFVTFEKMVKTQFNSHVKLFRSDNKKEYVNNIFGQFLQ